MSSSQTFTVVAVIVASTVIAMSRLVQRAAAFVVAPQEVSSSQASRAEAL